MTMLAERRRELVARYREAGGPDPVRAQAREDVLAELAVLWRRVCLTCLGERAVARAGGFDACQACGGTGEARP